MNYYDHHIGDYRRDTTHLSLLEHGIYRQLLDTYYLTEEPLNIDINQLMRSHCVRSADEMQALKNVLSDFFTASENGYIHRKCDKIIGKYKEKSSKASASAKARWDKPENKPPLKSDSCEIEDANALPTECEGNANHKPITNNHISNTNVLEEARNCPHNQIIDIYHEILPMCPKVKTWTPARATQLRARWNEEKKRQNLEWWKSFFEYIAKCDFLVGRTDKPFFVDLEWIAKSKNFTKIREGKYQNRESA